MKFLFIAALASLACLPTNTFSQRDYFTPEEVELIRDAQRIDARVEVLTHAIDRRFAVLKIDVKAPPFKEIPEWGAAPAGSHAELLIDIRHILQKAVDDVDNLSERPSSMPIEEPDPNKKKKDKKPPPGFAELFPIAVRSLAAAAGRYQPALKAELDKTKSEDEQAAILATLELCDEITASVNKLSPAPTVTQKSNN